MIVRVRDAVVDCKEARTLSEWGVGLSKTPSLEAGQGLLFMDTRVSGRTFWMPNTMAFPIDIIFMDAKKRITQTYLDCKPGDGKHYKGQAQYVLEVPSYFCHSFGVQPGDQVEFEDEVSHESMQSSDILRGLTEAKQAQAPDMSLQEFVDLGLLQEVNREFFHPIGLAMAVTVEDDGRVSGFGGIMQTDDPEGFLYDPSAIDQSKVERAQEFMGGRLETRRLALGFKTQTLCRTGQSIETAPYSRAPSTAPSTPPDERFEMHDLLDDQSSVHSDSLSVTQGPIHDESWNSPTRGASRAKT